MSPGWQAGSAIASFPIAPGTPLGGYLDRAGSSTATLDEFQIGALVPRCGNRRLAIVTADVVGVDTALVDAIATARGIPRAELLLSASHTHSGPRGIVERLHPADSSMLDPACGPASSRPQRGFSPRQTNAANRSRWQPVNGTRTVPGLIATIDTASATPASGC